MKNQASKQKDEPMKDFYQQAPQQQAELLKKLAKKAIAAWGFGRDAELELIGHRENAVFKVTTAKGDYALRVHRHDYHSDDALRSELQWMAALLKSGIATPEIIKTRQGDPFTIVETEDVPEPRQVDLFGWINGVPISDLTDKKDELSMHCSIGELMARLHNHAGDWTPPKKFYRHSWDEEGLLGENPLWGRFWELKYFNKEQRDKILKARTIAMKQLKDFGRTDDRYGLIHCDFLPQNLLKDGGTVRIIDFDDCGYGWHMFDIATSLFFYTIEGNIEGIKKSFIQGYRSQRELSDEQLDCFDFFLLLRLMTACGWMHTRSETEQAQQFGAILADYLVTEVEQYLALHL
jgi:Ser/Thr protein kinase RdoA (MazF antagonist)